MKSLVLFCCAALAVAHGSLDAFADLPGLHGPSYSGNVFVDSADEGRIFTGYAHRINGGGEDAWYYNGASDETIQIGLLPHATDTSVLSLSGLIRSSTPTAIAGDATHPFVIGAAVRFHRSVAATFPVGQRSWIYDGVATKEIGLEGSFAWSLLHPSLGFSQYHSEATHVNSLGQAVGYTNRYNLDVAVLLPAGQNTWFYDGTTTHLIGLTDSAYTSLRGPIPSQESFISNFLSDGTTLGYSYRYEGTSAGLSVPVAADHWVYKYGRTVALGLSSPTETDEFIAASYQVSNSVHQSILNVALNIRSGSGWHTYREALFDNGFTLTQIGLRDGQYGNSAFYINDNGNVAGVAYRSDSPVTPTTAAWLFDGNTTVPVGFAGPGLASEVHSLARNSPTAAGVTWDWVSDSKKAWIYHEGVTREIRPDSSAGVSVVGASFVNNAGQALVDGIYLSDFASVSWFYDFASDRTLQVLIPDNGLFPFWQYLGEDGLAIGAYETPEFAQRYFFYRIGLGAYDLTNTLGGPLSEGFDNGQFIYLDFSGSSDGNLLITAYDADWTPHQFGVRADLLVPEPSTSVLSLGGLLLAFVSLRRRSGPK